MSQEFNPKRRNLIKSGLFSGFILLINKNKVLAKNIINEDNIIESKDGNKITQDSINQVISVRIWPSDVYTRLTIEAEENIKVKYFSLTTPNRFVIDILNSNLNAALKNLSNNQFTNDPIIGGIKVGQNTPTTVRIVLYVRQPVSVQTKAIEPVSLGSVNYKHRYVLDMFPSKKNFTQDESSRLDDQLLAFLQLNADKSLTGESEAELIAQRSKSYPEITIPGGKNQAPNKGKILVMIDPGHGGEDPGAIGPQGTKEKHVVLDIAKKLYNLINSSTNMQAQLTRSQDIFIPLATRVAIARKARADIFVSVHADAFSSPQAHGSSVFILSPGGASSAFAKYMAISQNNSDLIGGMSFKNRDNIVNRILLDMTQSYTLRKSSRLGQIILSQLKGINKLHSNSVEQAGFAVLKAPDIPSILVESAFVSNPVEEELLRTDTFRHKVAWQIFDGLKEYARQNYKLA